MPTPLQFITGRRTLFLAASFLAVTLVAWADTATTVPPSGAPGTPLPASGANQEPAPASKAALSKNVPDKSDDKPLPEIKPILVHSGHDADIARIVGNDLEQNHYLQKAITPEMSQRWLKNYLLALDYNHLFFLQSDVDEFTTKYGNSLGDLLLHGDDDDAAIAPAFVIFNRYMQRVSDDVKLVRTLVHDKYDFTQNETFTIRNHKSPWIQDAAAAQANWRGQIKSQLLNGLLDKKSPDVTTNRIIKQYTSLLRERSEMEEIDVLELYLDSLAHAYDPHSDYFAPEEAQNFTIQSIDLAVTGIGAVLKSDDGYATIEEVIPGGPADLDKRLQAGDRILAVGQGTNEPIDAVNMKLNRVVDLIRGRKGSSVHLVILPAGAADTAVHKDIVIKRDTVSIKESKAKAHIIDHPLNGGSEKIGVITLPGFYKDAAVDTAKLLVRLKQENVAGVILDFRNNGGGLLDQAVDLTGLFVKREPVVQIRRPSLQVDQLSPDDSRPIYSGPLLVMVNKASASATEIVAGALQDYGRAIVVGDTSTHGKGTVQTLIPLDQQAPIGFAGDPGKLKITVQKFYRVAGGSTQQKGVVPDIVLPSILDALELGETTLDYYLPYDTVPPVPFDYLNLVSPYLPALKTASNARVAASPDFNYVRQDIAYYKKKVDDSTVSLNLAERQKEQDDYKALQAQRKKDLEARKGTRDKLLDLTLDMVDNNLPAAPPVEKKPKLAADDADGDQPDIESSMKDPVDDPQMDESVDIMCDYTRILRDAGSKLVQANGDAK